MRAPTVASAATLAATACWTVVMVAGTHGYDDLSLLLVGVALWAATVAGIAGLLLVASRWSRRLLGGVAAAQGLLAARLPIDAWWWGALAVTAVAAVAVLGPLLDGYVRRRPGTGPPGRAIALPLALLATTYGVGIAGAANAAAVGVALSALVTAFWFIRAFPGALAVVRVAWPLGAAVAAVWMPFSGNLVAMAGAVVVAALAWHPSVRLSLHPLTGKGSVVPIPPELAPRGVLDVAEVDDGGRPR